jgi:purine-nucleoside phosphorylase
MPTILLRAEQGDRPPHVLVVESAGLAERVCSLLDGRPAAPELIGTHRGLSAFRGWWQGRPVAVQTTGVGAPATAMVVEELLMTGAQRLVRVASAVGVAADIGPGDVVVPLAAGAADGTTRTYVHGAPIAPAADFPLVDALTIRLAAAGSNVRHGSVTTVDVMPDQRTIARWRRGGVLALEMGSAPLFYLGARAAATAPGGPGRVAAASVLVIGDAGLPGEGPPTGAVTAEDVMPEVVMAEEVVPEVVMAEEVSAEEVSAEELIADDVIAAALGALTSTTLHPAHAVPQQLPSGGRARQRSATYRSQRC